MKEVSKNTIISKVGLFPELNEKFRKDFPVGEIVLKHGEHRGPNKGFGIVHILKEHKSDLTKHNLDHSDEGVICYVKLILRSGARIYSEFASLRGFHRPMVILSSIGTVVLERKDIKGKTLYSVVTAFGGNKVKGIQIGRFN